MKNVLSVGIKSYAKNCLQFANLPKEPVSKEAGFSAEERLILKFKCLCNRSTMKNNPNP